MHPLTEARNERGWSMRKLAGEAGVSVGTVEQIENLKIVGRIPTYAALGRTLGLAWHELVAPEWLR